MALYAAIAAVALKVIGTMSQAQNEASQAKAASAANQYNAAVLRQKADMTTAAFNQREEQQRRTAREAEGKRMASIAEAGLGFGGSQADFERQSEVRAELDALNIRYEGQTETRGLLAQATLQDYEATINRKNASKIRQQGYLAAASQALSSYANFGGMGASAGAGGGGIRGGGAGGK